MKNSIIKILIVFISFVCVCLFIFSCIQEKNPLESDIAYQYKIPSQLNDGWETSSLTDVGMDQSLFVNLMNELNEIDEHRIHSLLIIKNDKLVFEEYFQGDKFNLAQYTGETGFDRDDTHDLCSVTKSFTSALIGIAIDMGYIQSTEQKMLNFFPEYSNLIPNWLNKNEISLKHLLTMTSGIEWDDETYSYFDSRNDMYQLFNSSNPIRYILLKDLIEVPGEVFAYRNCNTNVLGEIVRKATLERLDVFAENYLFSKLEITDFEWQMLPNDVVFCSGDLRLRPRDMAKFGYLFLNDGNWKGEQIISNEWINISTQKTINPNDYVVDFNWADGYGYQWWIWENVYGFEFQAYLAAGWGGQWIIVCPLKNLVIVSTAGNYYTDVKMSIEYIIAHYIIPSIR